MSKAKVRDVVPDDRPPFEEITLPPRQHGPKTKSNQAKRRKMPQTFKQGKAGRQWNKYRAIDGKNFKRDKMYPKTKKGLEQARKDAEFIRNNPPSPGSKVRRRARILKFKDSYHIFVWPGGRVSSRPSREAWMSYRRQDENPSKGEVDGIVTKFYRKKNEARRATR